MLPRYVSSSFRYLGSWMCCAMQENCGGMWFGKGYPTKQGAINDAEKAAEKKKQLRALTGVVFTRQGVKSAAGSYSRVYTPSSV